MEIYLLYETYYEPNEDIISRDVIKTYVCGITAEKHRREWEESNDDERVEYSVEPIQLEDY